MKNKSILIIILITCLSSSSMAEANSAGKPINNGLMNSQIGTTYTQVVAGDVHTCALTSVGGVKCWGYNGIGDLGDGSVLNTQRDSPVDVVGLASGVTQLATGYGHMCAVTSVGRVNVGAVITPANWEMAQQYPTVTRLIFMLQGEPYSR